MIRCQALSMNGRQCARKAHRRYRYHGDGEIYGTFHEPWPSWVLIWLCEQHRNDQHKRKSPDPRGGVR